MNERIRLFFTGFAQVTLVSMNVVFISKGLLFLMCLTGFLISLVWTLNVKKIAFGVWRDRIVYSTGAMLGTLIGFLLANNLIKMI